MAQLGKGKLNYRCPLCFMRDLDIDMFYNKETGIYSCIRCQFRGCLLYTSPSPRD